MREIYSKCVKSADTSNAHVSCKMHESWKVCLACIYRVMDVCGKLEKHERSV